MSLLTRCYGHHRVLVEPRLYDKSVTQSDRYHAQFVVEMPIFPPFAP